VNGLPKTLWPKRIPIKLEEESYKKLKELSIESNLSIAQIIRIFIRYGLKAMKEKGLENPLELIL
jgi:hypothetical protein